MVCIEGPNSSGKSTLLNIIALGLFGTKSSRINPILQSKMHSLLDSSHQKLKFSFEIISGDKKLSLKSEKADLDGTEIVVKESTGGKPYKPLSFENFEKGYNLVYDIPNNPTERLSELLKELKEEQLQYGNRFKDFGFFLRTTITQISNSRDPKRLKDVKSKLADARSKKKKIDEELPRLQTFLDSLEKSAYIRYYCYYTSECERLRAEHDKAEKKIKQFDKNGKKITTKLKEDKTRVGTLQTSFTEKYNIVTPLIEAALPRKERSRFKIWKDINPYCTESDDLSTAKIEVIHFADLFSCEIEEMEKESSFKDANMLGRILQSLKEFEDSALMIPKFEVTFGEFVRMLKDQSKESSYVVQRHETLSEIAEILDELTTIIEGLQKTLKELKKESVETEELSGKAVETYYGGKLQLKKIGEDLELKLAKRSEYLQRCLSKNVDGKKLQGSSYLEMFEEIPKDDQVEKYLSLSENQIIEKISELSQEIMDKRSELKALDSFITLYEKEEQRFERQKPHKYEAHHELLTSLLQTTEAVSQRLLNEYNNYLKSLIDKKVNESDVWKDASKTKYYNEVSKYLAHRIGSFRHIDKVYKARIVDLISGIIITDDGTTIHITDMGTGQSQSAYILSLLNVKNDKRKIIALFDEIAMMDDTSLEPIISKMQELYKKNRLLLGILVQMSNELKVRTLA